MSCLVDVCRVGFRITKLSVRVCLQAPTFCGQRCDCGEVLLNRVDCPLIAAEGNCREETDPGMWTTYRPSLYSYFQSDRRYYYPWRKLAIGASKGGGGVRTPPRNLVRRSEGVRGPVKYPQDPLIKQVLYLYCVMDTAENMNVWRSLAWT